LRAIDQLAAEEGLSRDEFISKPLSQILAEFEIAGHLLPEQKVALENWERRICQIQKDYGTLFAIYARPR
jgi:hypothetical protein